MQIPDAAQARFHTSKQLETCNPVKVEYCLCGLPLPVVECCRAYEVLSQLYSLEQELPACMAF